MMKSFRTIHPYLMVCLFATVSVNAQIEVGKTLPAVNLSGDNGGSFNGMEWKSSDLINQLNVVFYVAPDQQNDVEPLLDIIDRTGYSTELMKVTLIINTKATWIPDAIIEGKVKTKAEVDKTKTYVLDKDAVLLNGWILSKDNPNIIITDKSGSVIYFFNEKLNEDSGNDLLKIIESEINKEEF